MRYKYNHFSYQYHNLNFSFYIPGSIDSRQSFLIFQCRDHSIEQGLTERENKFLKKYIWTSDGRPIVLKVEQSSTATRQIRNLRSIPTQRGQYVINSNHDYKISNKHTYRIRLKSEPFKIKVTGHIHPKYGC